MRSSLIKHLWLIQPQEAPPPVLPIDAAGGSTVRFSPAWELLCLRAFILERTGHSCTFMDLRLHDSIAEALDPRHRAEHVPPALVLIYATTAHLGSAGEIVSMLKQKHPDIPVALFGPHVVSHPETLELIPGIDFGLRGDPELLLRHLLDGLDVPHRLKLVPGLLVAGEALKPAHWLPDLKALSLPPWETMEWSSYRPNAQARGARVEARLSRGHPGTRLDLAWPVPGEPLRIWPQARMAQLLQKCSGNGIMEVVFSDPPGYWTNERIMDWCRHLKALRNTQPWSFQIIPRPLPEEVVIEMAQHGCRRLELLIPSLEEQKRRDMGMDLTDLELRELLDLLKRHSVDPQLIYWIEGPWSHAGEAEAILQHVKQMGRPSFGVYLFPLHHDAPLFDSIRQQGGHPPALDEWTEWAQQWPSREPPAALWQGSPGLKRARQTISHLHRRIARDPHRILKRFFPAGTAAFSWFGDLPKAAGWENKWLRRNRGGAQGAPPVDSM